MSTASTSTTTTVVSAHLKSESAFAKHLVFPGLPVPHNWQSISNGLTPAPADTLPTCRFQRTTKERRRRDAQLAHDREIAQKKMLRLAEQKLEDDRRRFSALAEQLMHVRLSMCQKTAWPSSPPSLAPFPVRQREKNAYIKDLTEQGRQQRVDDVAQVQLAAWLQAGAVATVFAVAILQHLMRERTGGCPTPDLTSLPSWLSFLPVASFVSFTTGAFCSVVQIFTVCAG